ncbi:hypothetical protein V8C34DRAFT_281946 [Trichoderma compactum]
MDRIFPLLPPQSHLRMTPRPPQGQRLDPQKRAQEEKTTLPRLSLDSLISTDSLRSVPMFIFRLRHVAGNQSTGPLRRSREQFRSNQGLPDRPGVCVFRLTFVSCSHLAVYSELSRDSDFVQCRHPACHACTSTVHQPLGSASRCLLICDICGTRKGLLVRWCYYYLYSRRGSHGFFCSLFHLEQGENKGRGEQLTSFLGEHQRAAKKFRP